MLLPLLLALVLKVKILLDKGWITNGGCVCFLLKNDGGELCTVLII